MSNSRDRIRQPNGRAGAKDVRCTKPLGERRLLRSGPREYCGDTVEAGLPLGLSTNAGRVATGGAHDPLEAAREWTLERTVRLLSSHSIRACPPAYRDNAGVLRNVGAKGRSVHDATVRTRVKWGPRFGGSGIDDRVRRTKAYRRRTATMYDAEECSCTRTAQAARAARGPWTGSSTDEDTSETITRMTHNTLVRAVPTRVNEVGVGRERGSYRGPPCTIHTPTMYFTVLGMSHPTANCRVAFDPPARLHRVCNSVRKRLKPPSFGFGLRAREKRQKVWRRSGTAARGTLKDQEADFDTAAFAGTVEMALALVVLHQQEGDCTVLEEQQCGMREVDAQLARTRKDRGAAGDRRAQCPEALRSMTAVAARTTVGRQDSRKTDRLAGTAGQQEAGEIAGSGASAAPGKQQDKTSGRHSMLLDEKSGRGMGEDSGGQKAGPPDEVSRRVGRGMEYGVAASYRHPGLPKGAGARWKRKVAATGASTRVRETGVERGSWPDLELVNDSGHAQGKEERRAVRHLRRSRPTLRRGCWKTGIRLQRPSSRWEARQASGERKAAATPAGSRRPTVTLLGGSRDPDSGLGDPRRGSSYARA
ncbi:hypothetical protein GGX14DRAFT_386848 [Mycena pura]|uniref:Uncharacterized protein n=1 Tax=Mycena pura TaxID=153505 RepID=A0AAD6YMJ3_9AGAR|nr:hypothetical protein GGX14DRAFT_386848 [Mycena pura]